MQMPGMESAFEGRGHMKKAKTTAIIFFFVLLSAVSVGSKRLYAQTVSVKAPLNLHVIKHSSTALKITWNPVEGAGGYEIYRCRSGSRKFKKVKTIKTPKKTSWINKKLKTNKIYKYQIKAYANINGKRKRSRSAYTISAKTYTKKSKTVNVNRVETDTYLFEIDMGKSEKFYARAITTKKKKKVISKKVRWYSKNKDIATITKDGKLTAGNKAGVCYVYAKAHNGKNSKKFPVYVLDPSTPKSFYLEDVTGKAKTLLAKYKKEVCQVAKHFTNHRPNGEMDISYDKEDGWEISPQYVKTDAILGAMKKIFNEFGDKLMITANKEKVYFTLEEPHGNGTSTFHIIEYYYNKVIYDYYWDEGYMEIADYWGYYSYEAENE